jgi:hypothetical protein
MTRSRILRTLVLAMALPLFDLANVLPKATPGGIFVRQAHAFVGAPLTPVSVAGVARRTTRRVVVAESAAQQQAAAAQQQQAAAAQQQQAAAARPAGAPPVGAVVSALPAGCVPEAKSGVEYQNCGGVYYRAAFQGNNLVYVVQ